MRVKGELTLKNIVNAKIPVFDFTGEWYDAFGKPQRNGVWFIYGNSGHGKTTFLLMLMKQLANFGNIMFVPYEEGNVSVSLQKGINRLGLLEANKKVIVCTHNSKDLAERLSKRKSPEIVIIDSLDLSEFKQIKQVADFKNRFKNKTLIFTGWADGKVPANKIGKDVLYLANQKIFVEGYRAISRGRSLGERGYLTIWEEGATEYWKFK